MKTITVKTKCVCECHTNPGIMHFTPCCTNGYNEIILKELQQVTYKSNLHQIGFDQYTGMYYHIKNGEIVSVSNIEIDLKSFLNSLNGLKEQWQPED